MSFQDVKKRQHPIFDNHRYSTGPSSEPNNTHPRPSSGQKMKVDRRQTSPSTRHKSNTSPQLRSQYETPTSSVNHRPLRSHDHSTREKGVRPRLTTACPVTEKNLLHEEESVSTHETQSAESFSDEQSIQLPRTKRVGPKSQSRFAHITNAIVNFQKMVAELEGLLNLAGTTPEAQWRSRILVQSAKDADRDIQLQLDKLSQQQDTGPKVTALRKLQRDFGRARHHLTQTVQQHERRQQAEVAVLGTQNDEDFFDKAMRERDAAVKQLHSSLNQVNAIYQDLADLVEEQQHPIDHLDKVIEDAKVNTRDGLKQVQAGIFGMCAGEGQVDDDVQRNLEAQKNKAEEGYRVGENFDWGMPFETLGQDLQSVQADVVKFGQGLWDEFQGTVVEGRLSGCANALDCQDVAKDEITAEVSLEETEKEADKKSKENHRTRRQDPSSRRKH